MAAGKLEDFKAFLETASLPEEGKLALLSIAEFLAGRRDSVFAGRFFAMTGSPGVGKTCIARRLSESVSVPVVFAGFSDAKLGNAVHCGSLKDVLKAVRRLESCLVVIDDFEYLVRKNTESGGMLDDDEQLLMGIFEAVAASERRALLCVSQRIYLLNETLRDRLEAEIKVELPSDERKTAFLAESFAGVLKPAHVGYLARASIGYNYRDLQKIVRASHIQGNGSVTSSCLEKAVASYVPPSFEGYDVYRNTKIKFRDVVGREMVKKAVMRAFALMKNRKLSESLGVSRANFLLFHGPPGTGKTFLTRALAGEVKWPLLSIKARHIYGSESGLLSLRSVFQTAKRFSNCVIFVDEAEKLLARGTYDEDNPLQGDLQSELDGIDGPVNSIVVFAVNDLSRFSIAIQDRFNLVRFTYPDERERREFLERKIRKAEKRIDLSIDKESLVRMTEEMSFRTIEKAWNQAVYAFLETGKAISTNDFSQYLKEATSLEKQEAAEMFG